MTCHGSCTSYCGIGVCVLTMLNQLLGKPGKRAVCALDNGSVSHLKGERFSTPCSFIVDTNAMGRGTMPEIMSLYINLAIAALDECLMSSDGGGRTSYLFLLCCRHSTLQIRLRPRLFLQGWRRLSGHMSMLDWVIGYRWYGRWCRTEGRTW